MKPFKTVDEQIAILKSRGLTIPDNELEEVRINLLKFNYYCVINGYGKLFEKENNTYIEGCSFDEIMNVYLFDKNLKSSIYPSLISVEACFKTLVAHFFSKNHKEESMPYLLQTNFDTTPQKYMRFIKEVNNIIEHEKRKKGSAVTHYMSNHNSLPLWVLINYMTFGQTVFMFMMMKDKDKNAITKEMNGIINKNLNTNDIRLSSKDLYQIMDNIKDLRNDIAHDNRIFEKTIDYNLPYIEAIHKPYGIAKNSLRNTVFDIILFVRLFANDQQYQWGMRQIQRGIKLLKQRLKSISPNVVLKKIGFILDWK